MQYLRFGASFDALICLDGSLPEAEVFRRCAALPLIAADGAAVKLFRLHHVRPTVIVGDLDALLRAPEREFLQDVPVVQVAEQETNDFEKALNYARQQGWRRLLVLGFQGEEPDHTLINWSVAVRYASQLELCFYDAGRYGFLLRSSVLMELEVGETISLIPQPYARVTTAGFVWELRDVELAWGKRESARNLVRHTPVQVELHEGVLLCFCRARLPSAPLLQPLRGEDVKGQ